MRHFLANTIESLARFVRGKAPPPALGGRQWSAGTIDAYRRQRAPTPVELLQELKNTAWTCASINASVCAGFAPKLYVTTKRSDAQPKCPTKALRAKDEEKLRSLPHLASYTGKALSIEEVTDHPLLTLLRHVNPAHNAFDLWELTQLYLETNGSAYWLLDFHTALGIPQAIWTLPAQNVCPKRERGSRQLFDYYEYRSAEGVQRFTPEQIIHFRFPDPRHPYASGLSPLRACYEQVALTSEYVAMKRAIYDNAGLPSVVISPEEVIGEDERARLENEWNTKFRRGGNGRALVAESGMSVDIIQSSLGDLAALAEAQATKEDIANAFHVPLAYLTKDTNMANIQASAYQHMTLAVRPRLQRRDEKINEQLMPLYDPSGRLFVASEDPVPESQDAILKQQEIDLKMGVKAINEVRQEPGLPPVEWGNVPWLPLNWKPTDHHVSEQSINVTDGD